MKMTISMKNVAALLKATINRFCNPEDFWFPDIDETKVQAPTVMEILEAIRILEKEPDREITITEQEDDR